MSDPFDLLADQLHAAALSAEATAKIPECDSGGSREHQASRRPRPGRRVVAATVLAGVIACGTAIAATKILKSGTTITSASCSAAGSNASAVRSSCTFVLSNGERFVCTPSFAGSRPGVEAIERSSACSSTEPLHPPAGSSVVAGRIVNVRRCLASKGLTAYGGVAPQPVGANTNAPAGELTVASDGAEAVIAFYESARRARQLVPQIEKKAARFKALVEQQGPITIVWAGSRSSSLHALVTRCLVEPS